MARSSGPGLDDPNWWYRTGITLLVIGFFLTLLSGGFDTRGVGGTSSDGDTSSGGWWDGGNDSGNDSGSWDWDSGGDDSGSWDWGGSDSGSWDSGGSDGGSWDSGGSDSGSW